MANVAIRINPELRVTEIDQSALNIDQRFKFGVALTEVIEMSVRAKASSNLKVTVSQTNVDGKLLILLM